MGHRTQPRTIIADMTVLDTDDRQLWEILVPTVGNDGTPFRVRHHRQWDDYVTALSGGMTLIGPVRGTWLDPSDGAEYTERMIPVRILCTEAQIVDVCKETARHYDQIQVLAALVAPRTVLVENPHARATRTPQTPHDGTTVGGAPENLPQEGTLSMPEAPEEERAERPGADADTNSKPSSSRGHTYQRVTGRMPETREPYAVEMVHCTCGEPWRHG